MKPLLTIAMCALMCACGTIQKTAEKLAPPPDVIVKTYTPLPSEPEWQAFTRAPIVSKHDNNFLVTNEFIVKAGQQQDWIQRVKEWKTKNGAR